MRRALLDELQDAWCIYPEDWAHVRDDYAEPEGDDEARSRWAWSAPSWGDWRTQRDAR